MRYLHRRARHCLEIVSEVELVYVALMPAGQHQHLRTIMEKPQTQYDPSMASFSAFAARLHSQERLTKRQQRHSVLVDNEIRVDRVVRVARLRPEYLSLVRPSAGLHSRRGSESDGGVLGAGHGHRVVRVVLAVVERHVWSPDVVSPSYSMQRSMMHARRPLGGHTQVYDRVVR